jgi:hypothetical protein
MVATAGELAATARAKLVVDGAVAGPGVAIRLGLAKTIRNASASPIVAACAMKPNNFHVRSMRRV